MPSEKQAMKLSKEKFLWAEWGKKDAGDFKEGILITNPPKFDNKPPLSRGPSLGLFLVRTGAAAPRVVLSAPPGCGAPSWH